MNSYFIKVSVSIFIVLFIANCHAESSKFNSSNDLSDWQVVTECGHKYNCDIYAKSNQGNKVLIVSYMDKPKNITRHNSFIEIELPCSLGCSAVAYFKPPNYVGGPFPFIAVNYENETGLVANQNPVKTYTFFRSEPLNELLLNISSSDPQASGALLDIQTLENGFLIQYRNDDGQVTNTLMPYRRKIESIE